MRLQDAAEVARRLAAAVAPFCLRVEIAGSVRRACPEVKDVELVAVPRWSERPAPVQSLFAEESERVNLLHEWATRDAGGAGVRWIKPGTSEVVDWEPKPEGKYWRALVEGRVKLDLFLAAPENYGMIMAIRTGCAEFSQALMTFAKLRTPYHVEGGYLRDREGAPLETPEERDVFEALGVDFVEPHGRTGQHAVRRRGRPQFPLRGFQGGRS